MRRIKTIKGIKNKQMLYQRIVAVVIVCLSFFIHVKIQKPVFYPRSKNVQVVGYIWQDGIGQDDWWSNVVQSEDELLILVSSQVWIPQERLTVELAEAENGYFVDARCQADLQNMLNDCRTAGLSPLICSAYRTQEEQETLFWRQVERCAVGGRTQDEAYWEAAKSVAIPGTSEHQLGLAVDIVDVSYQRLNGGQENTPAQRWLMANCWRYGFILRYPREKEGITGYYYEPWHYRYVGRDVAAQIYLRGMCLEEYLAESQENQEEQTE